MCKSKSQWYNFRSYHFSKGHVETRLGGEPQSQQSKEKEEETMTEIEEEKEPEEEIEEEESKEPAKEETKPQNKKKPKAYYPEVEEYSDVEEFYHYNWDYFMDFEDAENYYYEHGGK